MSAHANQIIDLYRRHAREWTARRRSGFQEKKWVDPFIALLPEMPSVLDIGCGSGEPIGRYLFDRGCAVTGIDASPELIEIARENNAEATWRVSDMRSLGLEARFDGILAWNSTFHLTPDDQRKMFHIFARHAANGAALMFTSGPSCGEVVGAFEGEPLYHASLDPDEYRALLNQYGFEILQHVVEDPDCGLQTVWLARFQNKA
ncbi:class I SAM-dependent DNA methyltransferase [Roseobacter weihaiensis]|uniref:class I SAM-dependent DNA methyltransferase n=1 Tax=Roseobacter weihaiensis TaxID=2763262 RepID=UPI001D0B4A53|nr:class I SAM-dependent methyltransferase [Roseobacter sp. H9]